MSMSMSMSMRMSMRMRMRMTIIIICIMLGSLDKAWGSLDAAFSRLALTIFAGRAAVDAKQGLVY